MISQLFVPSIGGGAENQAISLSKWMASKGLKITVFARKIKGEPAVCIMNNIKVIRLWNINWSLIRRGEEHFLLGLLSNLSYAFSLALWLILYRRNFDIVHYYGSGIPTAFTAPIVKLLRKKSIAHITGLAGVEAGSISKGKFSWFKRLFIWLINFVDIFRTSGSIVEKGLIEDGIEKKKIVRIPNLVDTNIFHPVNDLVKKDLRRRLNLPLEVQIGSFSGILIKSKGVDFILRVWKTVLESQKDLLLVIIGEGPERKNLEVLTKELGISEKVRFTGLVSNVNEYLQASDVFIFPSWHPEGTPNAVLEAMASGIPIMTTKVGNLEDFIEDGVNAIFIDINYSEDCIEKLKRLLSDETLRKNLSLNAIRTVKGNNNPELVCQKYIDLYKQLLSDNRKLAIEREREWYRPKTQRAKTRNHPERFYFAHRTNRRKGLKVLKEFPQGRPYILSIGCGSGQDVEYILEFSDRIIGVDIAPEALLGIKKNFPSIHSICADALTLPFKDEVFDIVVASGLLHHLVGQAPLKEFLKEFYRVIKPGGKFLAIEPNLLWMPSLVAYPVNRVLQWIKPGIRGFVPHERPLLPQFVKREITRCGFNTVRIESASYTYIRFPMAINRWIEKNEDSIRSKNPFCLFGWFVTYYGKKEVR